MIQANQWYNIAVSNLTPSSTNVKLTIGIRQVNFNVSVDWGNILLTITQSVIVDIKISLRIRNLGEYFYIDVRSDTTSEDIISASLYDNNYWNIVSPAPAGSGETICIINDISEYNPETGGGSSSGDLILIQKELIVIGERINNIEDWFTLRTLTDGRKVLYTKYNIAAAGDISAGGISEESDVPTGTATTLGGLLNVDSTADDIYSIDKILVKKANETHYSVMDLSEVVGLDEDALSKYLTTNSYATHSWVEQQGYLTEHQDISGLLSKDEATNTYATQAALGTLQTAHDTLRNEFNDLEALLSDDTAGVIDTWNDVKAFLDGYSESEDLATILSKMNAQIDLKANQSDVNTILDWFTIRTLTDGRKVLYTKYNIAAAGDISAGGISEDIGSGEGGSYSRLDSWDDYNPANGDVLSAVLGYGLKTDIQSLQEQIDNMGGGGLSSVTVKIGNTAYNSVDGVVSLPSYPVVPTLLSEFADDVVAGHYLPIEGGTINSNSVETALQFKTSNSVAATGIIRNANSAYGFYLWNSNGGRLGLREDGTPHYNNKTLYHTGNFDPADYLPKSGGILDSGSDQVPLVLNSTGATTRVGFRKNNTTLGYLGFAEADKPLFINSGGGNLSLIHTGNIGEQSVNYATSAGDAVTLGGVSFQNILERDYSGSARCETIGWKRIAKINSTGNVILLLHRVWNNGEPEVYAFSISKSAGSNWCDISQISGNYNIRAITRIRLDRDGYIDFYYNYTLWNNVRWTIIGGGVAYTTAEDNPTEGTTIVEFDTVRGAKSYKGYTGNLEGNAASASKLATPRTIWGQSFDGTGNITGPLTIANNVGGLAIQDTSGIGRTLLELNSGNNIVFGRGISSLGYNVYYYANNHLFWYGKNAGEAMRINGNGNVLIGTITDDGYKLAVNGDVKSDGFVSSTIDIEKDNQTGEINRTSGKLYLQFNNYNHLILCQGGGYVGIGTATPAYRLDVSGTGRFTDSLTIGGATLTWDSTNNCLRVNTNLATDGELTAGGVSDDDSTDTGVSYNRLDSWDAYNAGAGDVLSATLGYGLKMNIEAIDGLISNLQSQIDALGSGSGGSVSGDYLPLTGGTLTGSITVKGTNTGYMWARESDGVALGRLETDGANLRFRDYNQLTSGGYHTIITHQNIGDYAISNTGGEIYGDLYTYANIISEAMIAADFISGNSGGEFSGDVYIAANLFVDGEFNFSDMRYKDVLENIYIPNDVIADAPIFRYRWADKFDNKMHIGTSAQYWEEYDNTLVSTDPRSGKLGLNYISLAVAMGQSNANEIRELKKEIVKLKEKLAAYEQ